MHLRLCPPARPLAHPPASSLPVAATAPVASVAATVENQTLYVRFVLLCRTRRL